MQCVEHPVDFKMIGDKNGGEVDESCRINARDFFVPTQVTYALNSGYFNYLLVALNHDLFPYLIPIGTLY